MKTLKIYLLILSLFTIFLKSNAADNTYYIWAGATKVNDEVNLLQSDNWSVSNTEYIAPPEGTQINSPTSNWVFDYEAYLPISGRTDNIFYRFQEAMINVGSITIVNHNASDTGYWTNGNTIEPTGASTGIKFVSGKGNSSWNIGTFTYGRNRFLRQRRNTWSRASHKFPAGHIYRNNEYWLWRKYNTIENRRLRLGGCLCYD